LAVLLKISGSTGLIGYTKKVRNVPVEMKREVYEEYGVTSHDPGDYEVDHLIPLELGGSNSIKNL
jgi:5-methylcytosine-specific restriction endonuclease McrA